MSKKKKNVIFLRIFLRAERPKRGFLIIILKDLQDTIIDFYNNFLRIYRAQILCHKNIFLMIMHGCFTNIISRAYRAKNVDLKNIFSMTINGVLRKFFQRLLKNT